MNQHGVLDRCNTGNLLSQDLIALIEFIDLPANLSVLVGIKGGDTGLCGPEGLACQTGLLQRVERDMVGHEHLHTV